MTQVRDWPVVILVSDARAVRVVIAENNAAIRYAVRTAFATQADIEVVGEAEDGSSAVRLAHELRPDVLVTGLAMPGLRGSDVIRALAQVLPTVRIVVFSREKRLRADALAAGATAFVASDAPEEELLQEVRHAAALAGVTPPPAVDARPRLGEYLLGHGLITEAQLAAALAWQRELAAQGRPRRLGELLQDLGAISPADLESALRPERRV